MDPTSEARDDALAALTRGPTLASLSLAAPVDKKGRRATAIYPKQAPSKPFSRSAAKRESVMALGSIEHLQHYFTKAGMQAKVNPFKPNTGAAPALGPATLSLPTIIAIDEDLPPSPAIPPPPPRHLPFAKTYTAHLDPERLRPGALRDLAAAARAWGIADARCIAAVAALPPDEDEPESPTLLSASADPRRRSANGFDVLEALRRTTSAIRAVRNYMLALPDDSAPVAGGSGAEFRPRSLGPAAARKAREAAAATGPNAAIRRAALDTLTALRALEERARLEPSPQDEAALSDYGPGSRAQTPALTSGSSEDGAPRRSVVVWSDDEEPLEDEEPKRARWDERLVLGGGWLYRTDVEPDAEREAVRRWINCAEDIVLAPTTQQAPLPKRRASATAPASGPERRERRVMSAGVLEGLRGLALSEEPEEISGEVAQHSVVIEEDEGDEDEEVDDASLPLWARRTAFEGDPLGRAHAAITALLPPGSAALPPVTDRAALFDVLAAGHALCLAYNTGVRRSRKPWGFIAPHAVHDIASAQGEWTFRRTDNLRLWVTALKLRYLIPFVEKPARDGGPPVFDPRGVARKEENWEAMLEHAIELWVDAVVRERRGESS